MWSDINFSDYKNEEGESVIQSILYEMAERDDMQPMVNAIIRHSRRENGDIEISSFIDHYFGELIDEDDKKHGMKTIWVNAARADMLKYIDEEVHIDDLTELVKDYKAWRKAELDKRNERR